MNFGNPSKPDSKPLVLGFPFLPPTANSYIRHSRGRHYKTQAALKFDCDVYALSVPHKMCGSSFRVTINLYFENKRRCDIDNRIKPLLDALVYAAVIRDDSLVDEIVVRRCHGEHEQTVVRIEEI